MNMNPTYNASVTADKHCAAKAAFRFLLVDMPFFVDRDCNVEVRYGAHSEIFDSNLQFRMRAMRGKNYFEQIRRIVKLVVRIN